MRFKSALLAVLAVTLLPGLRDAGAQLPSGVTPEQVRMFQNLPAGQRDSILQQLGLGGATGGADTPAGGSAAARNSVTVTTPLGGGFEAEPVGDRTYRVTGGESLLLDLSLAPEVSDSDADSSARQDAARVQAAQAAGSTAPAFITPSSHGRTPDRAEPESRLRLIDQRMRIINGNPYLLDRDGVLRLPGLQPIALNGLSKDDVQERLALEPALRFFHVTATLLKIRPTGAKALRPFGYDMLRGAANAFVPGTDLPASSDYRIATGDVLQIELYGQRAKSYTLPVDREGMVTIPDLGPVSVGGQSFGSVRSMLGSRIERQLIGTKARVSIGELRTTRVFVLGDAVSPGSYVVSSFGTVTSALFASGGVKPIGTLRKIEVKRAGKTLRQLDLYDVLLHGNTADDVRLESGDVVFVPPVGDTVGIDGEIRRPAIYELGKEHTAADVVRMAGGLTPDADLRIVTVERVSSSSARTVQALDLSTEVGRNFVVRTGDVLRVPAIRPVVQNGISVRGHVYQPATFEYRQGLRLSDVIPTLDELRPRADVHYVLIRREDLATRRISVISSDLAAALQSRGGPADLLLAPRDQVEVFDLESNRDPVVGPLIAELKRQSRPDDLASVVSIVGLVNVAGEYPHEPHMKVADLVRAGGGLRDSAYSASAELTRHYIATGGDKRVTDLRQVDLAAALRGDAGANVELQPYDVLTIKETPDWRRVEQVELHGEVRFPGTYQIRRGETLASVIERAGGLTPLAFPQGAVYTREDLKEKERQQLDILTTRLKRDIAAISLENSQTSLNSSQQMAAGQTLLDELSHAKPVGRLVINLGDVVRGKKGTDVTLRNGDQLFVPRTTEEISVLGEVQYPTSHLHRPGLTRDDAINLSGGYSPRADRSHVYVIHADGSVGSTSTGWLKPEASSLQPGDTVIVPFDAERMRPLPLWTSVTTIIYNLAVAVAAIGHL